jgi:agmatinase
MPLAATHAQRGLVITRQLLQRQHAGKALVYKIQERHHHPDPFNPKTTKGWKAALKEAEIPTTKFDQEIAEALELGLPGASSIDDKTIPTFSRGELPHFAGINTFLKAPYIEDSRLVGNYDCAVVGVPFDGGCTYRAGTRFGPQGIRRISALYTPYNYEKGIDLREQMVRQMLQKRIFLLASYLEKPSSLQSLAFTFTHFSTFSYIYLFIVLLKHILSFPLQTLCDIGDVFTIPANIEKSFDQISNAVAHIASKGTMPIILGGDHSIGFPTVRGIASVTSKNIGIIHVDRHADIQEKDLDERMHTTPYFHATNLPNVNPKNLVQIGIGGWQV